MIYRPGDGVLTKAFGRLGCTGAALFYLLCLAYPAQAASPTSSGPFSFHSDTDRGIAWIDFLFKGTPMPDGLAPYGTSLSALSDGLRHALGLYNVGMLIIGALLLFYHVVGIVVETAHYGTVLGRRTNKVWAPIRLVLAIGLLVPIGSGLSAGQYIVVKIAEAGSALASNAWQTVANYTSENLSALVTPHPPNAAALVVAATEMELCRLVYQQAYTQAIAQAPSEAGLQLAGPVGPLVKLAADRLSPETWRYSNYLNYTVPLCGEYHFSGYRPYDTSISAPRETETEQAAISLSLFAHAEADQIIAEASGIAGHITPTFLTASAFSGLDIHNELLNVIADISSHLDGEITRSGLANASLGEQVVLQSAQGGWLAAADIIPEMIRLQESYGELIEHALPSAEEPILDHPQLSHLSLIEALDMRSITTSPMTNTIASVTSLYAQVSRIMSAEHVWMNGSQVPKGAFIPASSLDLRDHFGISTDASAAFGVFASAFDTEAVAEGVWGHITAVRDTGYPFAADEGSSSTNPFTALAEFGRRQYRVGSYLLGLSGSALSSPGAIAPAALTALAASALFIGGLSLIFVVPFLPFFRFMMAALAWALNVFEAIAAMPIVALAHLTPTGDGLSGSSARQAYRLWLALLIRPLLTLLGFVLGFLLFTVALGFVSIALTPFAHMSSQSNSGLLIVANIALVFLFDIFAYAAANAAFKGIHMLPDQALRWISQFTVTEGHDVEPLPAPLTLSPQLASASASVTNLITQSSGGSVNVSGISTVSTSSSAGSSTTHVNAMKAALFPNYQEKPSVSPSPGAPTIIGSVASVTVQGADKKAPPKSPPTSRVPPKELPVKPIGKEVMPHDKRSDDITPEGTVTDTKKTDDDKEKPSEPTV